MSAGSAITSQARRGPPPPLRWRSWPIQEGGATAWVFSGALLGMTGLVGWIMASALWAFVACALMAIAAWRYFVPIYFEINHQGIFQEAFGRRQRISWRSIGAVEVCRDGLLLTPGDVLWAAARGLYLPWGQHRAEVLSLVAYHMQQIHPDEGLFGFDFNSR